MRGGWEEGQGGGRKQNALVLVPLFVFQHPDQALGLHVLSTCCERLWEGQDRSPRPPDGKHEEGFAHTSPAEPGRSEERAQLSPRYKTAPCPPGCLPFVGEGGCGIRVTPGREQHKEQWNRTDFPQVPACFPSAELSLLL